MFDKEIDDVLVGDPESDVVPLGERLMELVEQGDKAPEALIAVLGDSFGEDETEKDAVLEGECDVHVVLLAQSDDDGECDAEGDEEGVRVDDMHGESEGDMEADTETLEQRDGRMLVVGQVEDEAHEVTDEEREEDKDALLERLGEELPHGEVDIVGDREGEGDVEERELLLGEAEGLLLVLMLMDVDTVFVGDVLEETETLADATTESEDITEELTLSDGETLSDAELERHRVALTLALVKPVLLTDASIVTLPEGVSDADEDTDALLD